MALIGRRQLLAAGGATLAALSAGASAARAAGKSKIVFISDTHIADNTPPPGTRPSITRPISRP